MAWNYICSNRFSYWCNISLYFCKLFFKRHNKRKVFNSVKLALEEDIGVGDVTGELIDPHMSQIASLICREESVLCGKDWFNAAFEILDDQVEIIWHKQEGDLIEKDTVLQYQSPQIGGGFTNPKLGDQDWTSRGVIQSKDHWISNEGKLLTQGYISLQAESHPIDFKNIRLLDLCGCSDPKAKNYKSYYIKVDNSLCVY